MTVAITDAYASPTIARTPPKYANRTATRATERPAHAGRARRHTHTEECDAGRLVRRGDPRRRGRARGRPGREHRLRRRRVLLRPRPGWTPSARSSTRTVSHRLQLVGRIDPTEAGSPAPPHDQIFQLGASRASGSSSPPVTTATRSPTPGRGRSTPPRRPVGDRGRRHRPAVGADDTYLWETGWGTEQARAVRGRQGLDAPFGVPVRRRGRLQHLFQRPPTRAGRRAHAPAGPRRPTSRWTPTRPPACSSARRRLPRPAPVRRVPHRRHQPRLPAHRGRVRRCRLEPAGARLGFLNPGIYSRRATGGLLHRRQRRETGRGKRAPRLRQRRRRLRRPPVLGPHLRPGP